MFVSGFYILQQLQTVSLLLGLPLPRTESNYGVLVGACDLSACDLCLSLPSIFHWRIKTSSPCCSFPSLPSGKSSIDTDREGALKDGRRCSFLYRKPFSFLDTPIYFISLCTESYPKTSSSEKTAMMMMMTTTMMIGRG